MEKNCMERRAPEKIDGEKINAEKINIGGNAFLLPQPQVLVGAMLGDRANFQAVAWVSRVNMTPPYMAVALGDHATRDGVVASGEFSINIPSVDLVAETDLMGLVSGRQVDKSAFFEVFYGSLSKAPLIRQCPVVMECRVVKSVELPADLLVIGEVVGTWTEERYLTNGMPDILKVRPFVLSMPDNAYWAVGEKVGKAWHDGLPLRERLSSLL